MLSSLKANTEGCNFRLKEIQEGLTKVVSLSWVFKNENSSRQTLGMKHFQKMEEDPHRCIRKCARHTYGAAQSAISKRRGKERQETRLFKEHCVFILPAAWQGKDGKCDCRNQSLQPQKRNSKT